MNYGDIISLDGTQFKVVGQIYADGEEAYELLPIMDIMLYTKKYVDNNYKMIKENPIGIPVDFN